MARVFAALVWLALAIATPGTLAAERITAFESAVQIDQAGVLTVTETITVNAEHNQIRRGIFRDFPTTRGRTWWGVFRTSFTVLTVTRNGQPEPWFTERIADGVRLYIGSPDTELQKGPHTYALTYTTDRQIGFFDTHDELYWNATGNFWAFPIDRATATITAPGGATVKDTAAYRGPAGSTTPVTDISQTTTTTVFTATGLDTGEGLTVVVAWDKGFVTPPTTAQKIAFAFRDNAGVFTALAGLLLVTAYYLRSWWNYGRDPDPGTIMAEYDPPPEMSPAACRYVLNMAWDDKAFTSAVMNMAARGFIEMDKLSDGVFTLTKTGKSEDESKLADGERAVARRLFSNGESIALRKDRHKEIGGALKALRDALGSAHDEIHLRHNYGLIGIGVLMSVATLAAAWFFSPDIAGALIGGIFLGVVAAAAFMVLKKVSGALRDGGLVKRFFALMFLGVLAWLAFNGLVYVAELPDAVGAITDFVTETSILPVSFVVALMNVNLVFIGIMRAPTAKGRALMDRIEGFRHYMTVAEKDRLNFHNPPELTPERFEAYLPYAVALDVENAWGDQFHDAMSRVARERNQSWNDDAYRPRWYRKRGGTTGWSALSKSFSTSVSTAATAPSQSSGLKIGGGRRGGFSGGGGGGGGGGGW